MTAYSDMSTTDRFTGALDKTCSVELQLSIQSHSVRCLDCIKLFTVDLRETGKVFRDNRTSIDRQALGRSNGNACGGVEVDWRQVIPDGVHCNQETSRRYWLMD